MSIHLGTIRYDMVYERNFVFKVENLAPIGKSDHNTLCITLNTITEKQGQGLNIFSCNKGNYKVLEVEVNKIDWDAEAERVSVNELWLLLIGLLNDFEERPTPIFMNKINSEVPWLNQTIKKLIKKRDNLYKRYSKSG